MRTINTANGHEVVETLTRLLASNGEAVSRFGGWLAVLYKFVDAVLPQLTSSQRAEVACLFRQGVEDVMSLTDDLQMPAEYHGALLDQTNILLAALEGKNTAQG